MIGGFAHCPTRVARPETNRPLGTVFGTYTLGALRRRSGTYRPNIPPRCGQILDTGREPGVGETVGEDAAWAITFVDLGDPGVYSRGNACDAPE